MPDIDPPDDDETYLDFMDRCTDDADEDTCQTIWDDSQDEKSGSRGAIIRKTHAGKADGLDFVLSDETRRSASATFIIGRRMGARQFQEKPDRAFQSQLKLSHWQVEGPHRRERRVARSP